MGPSPSALAIQQDEPLPFRERALVDAYGHVKGRVRRVPLKPYLTTYGLGWHMNLFMSDITAEELVEVWERDGCEFSWLKGHDVEKWKLTDAARVLRKVRGQQNTLRLASHQRAKGRDAERHLWNAVKFLDRQVTLTEVAKLTLSTKSATIKRLHRLKEAGYAEQNGKLWVMLGDAAPGREPIFLDLHVRNRPVRQRAIRQKFPITPQSISGTRSIDSNV